MKLFSGMKAVSCLAALLFSVSLLAAGPPEASAQGVDSLAQAAKKAKPKSAKPKTKVVPAKCYPAKTTKKKVCKNGRLFVDHTLCAPYCLPSKPECRTRSVDLKRSCKVF